MKISICTAEMYGTSFPTGGISAFVRDLSELLRTAGHAVTIVHHLKKRKPLDPVWSATYREKGIDVLLIDDHDLDPLPAWHNVYHQRVSERLSAAIQDADVVYFQDWLGNGFHTVRDRRFKPKSPPVCATILHGSSQYIWLGMKYYPHVPHDIDLDFIARYAAQYSDFVASPSQWMVDWIAERGWTLPPQDRVRVLGCPLLNTPRLTHPKKAEQFHRIIFYGRMQTVKGFEVFVDAMRILAQEHRGSLNRVEEVVFLGAESQSQYKSGVAAARVLQKAGLTVSILSQLDGIEAQTYLADNAADSLVVVPSLLDNFPHTVVEASLIPDLNLICSNVGGIPEILGDKGRHQLFDPHPRPLAQKLAQWLARGPLDDAELGHYDAQAANDRWLDFNEELCDYARHLRRAANSPATASPEASKPSIDVCVPYFNRPILLPQLLLSLEHQIYQDFNVIVIDDGSTDLQAIQVFEQMRARYSPRGWKFLTKDNAFLGAARNTAARQSQAEYLCFIDDDDIAAPHMIETFLDGMRYSMDDCLSCYCYSFEGNEYPHELDGGNERIRPITVMKPLGSNLVTGLSENVLGMATMMIRRKVFEQLGGYSEDRNTGYEDYEFYIKLILEGYKYDVIPKMLYYKRTTPGSMSETIDGYQSWLRVERVYSRHLRPLGLTTLPLATHSMYLQLLKLDQLNREAEEDLAVFGIFHGSAWRRMRRIYRKLVPLGTRLRLRNIRVSLLKH